jgi:glutathione S-transferase
LIPAAGAERRRVLRRMALATGVIDKAGAAAYERLIRPVAYRWPDWIERCLTQAAGGLETLAAEQWPESARLDQAEITTACMLRYLRIAVPELLPEGRYPSLDGLSARCEARPEFSATCPADYAVPRSG